MTASEPSTLRPLTLSQLLDRAFRLYRNHFLVFIGIIALGAIPENIIQYALRLLDYPTIARATQQLSDPSLSQNPFRLFATQMAASGSSTSTSLLTTICYFILVQGLATGALVKAIEDSYLGRPVGILKSYQRIGGSVIPLLIALFFGIVIILVLFIWMIVPCVGWFTGLGMLIFFDYAVYLLIPSTVVIEQKRGIFAIQRAWELTRRRFWWVLGFILVLTIMGAIILIGPTALVTGATLALSRTVVPNASEETVYAIQAALSQTVRLLSELIYLPLQLTAMVLMYFDLRVRTEGFDLAMLAATSEEAVSPVEVTPAAPPSEERSLITLNEAGYFVAITLGTVALCAILYGILLVLVVAMAGATRGF